MTKYFPPSANFGQPTQDIVALTTENKENVLNKGVKDAPRKVFILEIGPASVFLEFLYSTREKLMFNLLCRDFY
jgi:hypothetical protein